MKKFLVVFFLMACTHISYSQITEVYPTSQRYLFNPYNWDNIQIDSAWTNRFIYVPEALAPTIDYLPPRRNEYQMYPCSLNNPRMVYGVAIPILLNLPIPRNYKGRTGGTKDQFTFYGYYWEQDNLAPRDDSVRTLYWNTFVDSINVLSTYYYSYDLSACSASAEHKKYVYLIEKNEDLQHPIRIADSTMIRYGVNATGWNRLQLPNPYNTVYDDFQHENGFIVPTLEVYFDHPMIMDDTFFVGSTVFFPHYLFGGENHYHSMPWSQTMYLSYPNHMHYDSSFSRGFSGAFVSDNGDFLPYHQDSTSYRVYGRVRYPGSIFNILSYGVWGGPMAIVSPPPCMKAHDLRASLVSYDSATVEWDIPVGVSHCRLEFGPQGFQPGTGIAADSLTEGRLTLKCLLPNTAYEVRVSCRCIYEGTWSDEATVSFTTDFRCPPVPAVVNSEVTDSTISVVWWMPDSADYSEVEYGPRGFAEGEGTFRTHITRNYFGYGQTFVSGLEPYTAYEVRIRNYCSHSDALSDWFSFDTVTSGPDTTTVGMGSVRFDGVTLRPNPATSTVTVSSPASVTRIRAVDLLGRKLCDIPVSSAEAVVDTSDWPRGTVLLYISTPNGTSVKKLTLE